MHTQVITGSDLKVSQLCLGTGSFGSGISEEASFSIMDTFVELGGNFIDTAYGYPQSEKTIGKWMRERNNRESIVVGTKGGYLNPQTLKLMSSRQELLAQIDSSRKDLGVDCIDLYWLHYDNSAYPVSHFINFLNEQVGEGRIRHFACSNWPHDRIREANAYASEHSLGSFVANQMWWSLATVNTAAYNTAAYNNRGAEEKVVGMDEEMFNLHQSTGLTAIPYSSQAKGFFSKLAERGVEGFTELEINAFVSPENKDKLERVKEVSEQVGASIAQVALAWILTQPFPTVPVAGCSRIEQLLDSVQATNLKLSQATIRYLSTGRKEP